MQYMVYYQLGHTVTLIGDLIPNEILAKDICNALHEGRDVYVPMGFEVHYYNETTKQWTRICPSTIGEEDRRDIQRVVDATVPETARTGEGLSDSGNHRAES